MFSGNKFALENKNTFDNLRFSYLVPFTENLVKTYGSKVHVLYLEIEEEW